KRLTDVFTTSPQRQIGTSLSSRGNFGNSVRSSCRRGKWVSKSSTVSIPSRRSARSFGRGIQFNSSSDCEKATSAGDGFPAVRAPLSAFGELLADFKLLTVHQSLTATGSFCHPYRFNMHRDQSLASIFVGMNAKCDVPRRGRQFVWGAVKIDRAAMSIALTQAKN